MLKSVFGQQCCRALTFALARLSCFHSMIGYHHETVLCLSIHLSVTKYIVAKRYILQQKCLKKWIESILQRTWFYNFQPPTLTWSYLLKAPPAKFQNFTYLSHLALMITWLFCLCCCKTRLMTGGKSIVIKEMLGVRSAISQTFTTARLFVCIPATSSTVSIEIF